MTAPSPNTGGPVRRTRLALWIVLALCLVAGVVLYFRFGADVAPVHDTVR